MTLTIFDLVAIGLISFLIFFCLFIVFMRKFRRILKLNEEIKQTIQFFTDNENERYDDLVEEMKALLDEAKHQ